MHASLAPDHPAIAGSRRRNWHRLANSRLPEKALAVEAGLGFIGKNSLLIVDRGIEPIGPSVVLGLLLMPVSVENARRAMIGSAEGAFADPDLPYVPEESDCAAGGAIPTGRGKAGFTCGACQSCFDACPTKAIRPEGGIRRELCLQHWAAVPGKLPEIVEANWGKRLYGCDLCMEACPWFRDASLDSLPSQGVLGPSLPAGFFLASTDNEIRLRLYGTALGLGWMRPDAFRRNAVRACETLRREGGKVPSHP
jgi:epoxyqueuosine reductase QueG